MLKRDMILPIKDYLFYLGMYACVYIYIKMLNITAVFRPWYNLIITAAISLQYKLIN